MTYENLGMTRVWRSFVNQLGRSVEFLHRDELEEKYSIKDVPLPAAFTKCIGEDPQLWLSTGMMNSCHSPDDLEQMVIDHLN